MAGQTEFLGLPIRDDVRKDQESTSLDFNAAMQAIDLAAVAVVVTTDTLAPNGSIYLASNRSNALTFKDLSGVTHTLTFTTP